MRPGWVILAALSGFGAACFALAAVAFAMAASALATIASTVIAVALAGAGDICIRAAVRPRRTP